MVKVGSPIESIPGSPGKEPQVLARGSLPLPVPKQGGYMSWNDFRNHLVQGRVNSSRALALD